MFRKNAPLKYFTSSTISQKSLPLVGQSSPIIQELKNNMMKKWQEDLPRVKRLKQEYGDRVLTNSTVSTAYSGMRDVLAMVYETSLLDPYEGIRFRGLTIDECFLQLPKFQNSTQPLPEAMLWLLLTGQCPTSEQAISFSNELYRRFSDTAISQAIKVLQMMPPGTHPMTLFSMGIMTLQSQSVFAKAYNQGLSNKDNYWEFALEDALNCIARTPAIAAAIYRMLQDGVLKEPPHPQEGLDWTGNFINQLGLGNQKDFLECMRLYLTLHADHEGGNISTHTTTLVGSALSDPYLSLSAGINGLAGPLHGLANQEVLNFILSIQKHCREKNILLSDKVTFGVELEKLTWNILNNKKVIPGYGHAVLRITDPRFSRQKAFAEAYFPNDELFQIVDMIFNIVPPILKKHGKTKNPYPNVDAHSGVLLYHYNMKEQEFYTVLFALSRQLGAMSGLVWDRLQGRPLERPKSITSSVLFDMFKV